MIWKNFILQQCDIDLITVKAGRDYGVDNAYYG